MQIGTDVEKVSGYRFPGVIVADFITLSGQRRLVVECTNPGCEGMLHIYNPSQLKESNAIHTDPV
jgi:hypothetical protein